MRIFISYAHSDSHSASQFAEISRAKGLDIFWDKQLLRSGEKWAEGIKTAIKNANAFVAFMPKPAEQGSNNIMFEIGLAHALSVPTYLVKDLSDQLDPSDLSIAHDNVLISDSDDASLHKLADQLAGAKAA
jgi:hypothetical protein